MSTDRYHVAYDLSGIQKFIFQIPRLRFVVGGSRLIHRFDHETAPGLAKEFVGVTCEFSGGGHGHFSCSSEEMAERLVHRIVEEAHRVGLAVRIGRDLDVENAIGRADEEYPYLPSEMDGEPCAESGLYPVPTGKGQGNERDVNPVVWRRVRDANGPVKSDFEDELIDALSHAAVLPEPLQGCPMVFFSDVSAAPSHPDEADLDHAGRLGQASLGNRNRWAIVAMDANDLGSQFRALDPDDLKGRRRRAREVGRITRDAFVHATASILSTWVDALPTHFDGAQGPISDGRMGVVLPIRPLVLGGDDVVVLCHTGLAMEFVRSMADSFEWASKESADLWGPTGGRLSISAGVLFAPVSYPLHTAVPYAETLLASAKHHGRRLGKKGAPPPSCLDWESVTEGLLDHPTARRRRELQFKDGDDQDREIVLTARPYTLDQFDKLSGTIERLGRELPASTLHSLKNGLRQGKWGRMAFTYRLRRNHPHLAEMIDEKSEGANWRNDGNAKILDVLDAVSLWSEQSRLKRETVK